MKRCKTVSRVSNSVNMLTLIQRSTDNGFREKCQSVNPYNNNNILFFYISVLIRKHISLEILTLLTRKGKNGVK